MKYFVDGKEITLEELTKAKEDCHRETFDLEVIEFVGVSKDNTELYFVKSSFKWYLNGKAFNF